MNLTKKRKGVLLVLILFFLIFFLYFYCQKTKIHPGQLTISTEGTDKARYSPGEPIFVSATVSNLSQNRTPSLFLQMNVYHLDQIIYSEQTELTLHAKETQDLSLRWEAPSQDYQGYLISLDLTDSNGNCIANDSVGVDVSSSWVKFPRYGYLCTYEKGENTSEKISQMNRYHINAIEYYDWHALHHEPLPSNSTRENPGEWEDWSGRLIDGTVLQSYLQNAHDRNMVNMAYNMIYAGTDSFVKDQNGNPTEAADWQLYFAPDNDSGEGPFSFEMGSSPSGNGNLYFMNPLNPDWQNYIFTQENHIFEVLDFDGWHGDTVGEWGEMTDATGNPLGTDKNGKPIYEVKKPTDSF